MSPIWWVLLASAALAAASTLFKRRKLKELPDISDEDFVNAYGLMFDDLDETVIGIRKAIAKCLGVPSQKLSPNRTFASLSEYTGFITEYELGMSELGDELAHLSEQAGLTPPIPFPKTVGELIHEMITAAKGSREPG